MHTALTVAGVALAGTALGAVTYTAVSAPSTGAGPSDNRQVVSCERNARIIGRQCVSVVHASPRGAAPSATPAVQATPRPVPAPPAVAVTAQDSQALDHNGSNDDRARNRVDDRQDGVEDVRGSIDDRGSIDVPGSIVDPGSIDDRGETTDDD